MNSRELNHQLVDLIIEGETEWIIFGNHHMDENHLTLQDMKRVAACVYVYQPTVLGLANIGITDQQIIYLVDELRDNTSLEKLYLPFNAISDHGAEALAKLITHNSSLFELILFCNEISNRGMVALAHSLITNDTLLELEVFCNPFTPDIADKFMSALAGNRELETLTLFTDNSGMALPKKLSRQLERNRLHHEQSYNDLHQLSFLAMKRQLGESTSPYSPRLGSKR